MALEKTQEVDLIGVDKETGVVVLTIIDELDWVDQMNHMLLLQEKTNVYLSFIESGEVHNAYPDSVGRTFTIQVCFKNQVPPIGVELLEKMAEIVAGAGFGFGWKYLDAN